MVNILVPTDLSELSKVAVGFAVKIANKLDGNVTLLHVINVVSPVRTVLRKKATSLEAEFEETTQTEMKETMRSVTRSARFAEPVKYQVAVGASVSGTIKREAKKLRSGLIVMGTQGATGLRKVVLGSNTTSMIAVSPIPVLAVPKDAAFKGFRNIVYATDMHHLKKELKLLVQYAGAFDATIHIVHVTSTGNDLDTLEEKMETIVAKVDYDKIVTMVLVDDSIDEAIDQYVNVNKADLLAMFTHNPTFYEKLFDRSRTRRMAFHSRVPLLAFKQQ